MTAHEDSTTKALPGGDGGALRLGAAVLEAAGLDDSERESYLRRLEATAPELALQVRRRLAASEDLADSFLSTPAAARLAGKTEVPVRPKEPMPAASLPAAQRYELGKSLGQGGMGRVVLAYDRQLERPVALKFLTRASPGLRRLFLAEARAQARVQHDHVLDVYDSGELAGEPYIAMRYVAGGTLSEAASGLTLEQKVRLLVQVAEGLHAAHREGLLHRDVKPSNVLLVRTPDGELRAQVSDFGLATQLGEAAMPAGGKVAGSPPFIAPERLQGPPEAVDRRSDLYSLGITMYWLFTGAFPFTSRETVDILHQAVYEPMPPPRHHLPSLPVELEAIVLRCTDRDPERRYSSARAVAADLQRYLDGEVVEAYAAGMAYRLTRFALRHRLVVALAAVAAAALLAASVGITVFALRAEAARKRAEVRQKQAEGLIRFMLGDLQKTLEPLGQLDVMTAIGDQAMKYFSSVPPSELSAEELFQRSEALNQIAYVRLSRAEYGKALTAYQESLALARGLVARDPGKVEWQKRLAAGHFFVGRVYWEQGDRTRALASFEAQLGIARRLAARHPSDPTVQLELANALTNIGSIHRVMTDPRGAAAAFGEALEILRRAIETKPADTELRYEFANKTALVGELLWQLGEPGAALERFAAAQAVMDRLVAQDPANAYWQERLALVHMLRANALRSGGEPEAARAHSLAFLERAQHLVTIEPQRAQWRQNLAVAHRLVSEDLQLKGDSAAARDEARKSVEILAKLAETEATPILRRLLAASETSLGEALLSLGERPAAERQARSALARVEPLAKEDPTSRDTRRRLVAALLLLGEVQSDSAQARAAWNRAASIFEPFARDAKDLDSLVLWQQLLGLLGRSEEAGAVQGDIADLRRQVIAAQARLLARDPHRP